MYGAWTKHIKDPAEAERFTNTLISSKPVLDRLLAILREDELAADRSEMDIRTFETPNWSHKQAFKNGYRSHMSVIEKLINLDQQRKPNDPK